MWRPLISAISYFSLQGWVYCAKGVTVLPKSSHSVIVPTEKMAMVILYISYWKYKAVSLLKIGDHVPQA